MSRVLVILKNTVLLIGALAGLLILSRLPAWWLERDAQQQAANRSASANSRPAGWQNHTPSVQTSGTVGQVNITMPDEVAPRPKTPLQQTLTSDPWEVLLTTRFEQRYMEEYDMYIKFPIFPTPVRELNGKTITIDGFFIPQDFETKAIFISAYPYKSCFFCGKAGPESVLEVYLRSGTSPKLRMDQNIMVRGRLELNDTDTEKLNYILRDAEIVQM